MDKVIKDAILAQEKGCISYKDFMELALYHPSLGYYNRSSQKIGKKGDFYTSSNVGEVFGRALGRLFVHLFESHEIQTTIIELGGGTGRIAQSILRYIQTKNHPLFLKISYIIIESSPYHQLSQQKHLSEFTNVKYMNSLEHVDKLDGIVFSNEFFDAFPVHVIEKDNHELAEVMITVKNDLFVEQLQPLQNKEILSYLQKHRFDLQPKQRLEIPLAMEDYFYKLCEKIQKGFLLTIDYGYTNQEWRNIVHREGSLRGYGRHQMFRHILEQPGEIDITTHIHWDTLMAAPLQTLSFLPQDEFLISCGLLEDLQSSTSKDPFAAEHKQNRAIRTLLQAGQISSYFYTLLQAKNVRSSSAKLFPYVK